MKSAKASEERKTMQWEITRRKTQMGKGGRDGGGAARAEPGPGKSGKSSNSSRLFRRETWGNAMFHPGEKLWARFSPGETLAFPHVRRLRNDKAAYWKMENAMVAAVSPSIALCFPLGKC